MEKKERMRLVSHRKKGGRSPSRQHSEGWSGEKAGGRSFLVLRRFFLGVTMFNQILANSSRRRRRTVFNVLPDGLHYTANLFWPKRIEKEPLYNYFGHVLFLSVLPRQQCSTTIDTHTFHHTYLFVKMASNWHKLCHYHHKACLHVQHPCSLP